MSIIKIEENIIINEKVLLEKGDKIKILKEQSFDFDDIFAIVNSSGISKEFKGLINYVNKNRNKFSAQDIKDFVDWFNEIEDIDMMDQIIKKHLPTDTFENLP